MFIANDTGHWLSMRVRVLCVVALVSSLFFPDYIPPQFAETLEFARGSYDFLVLEEGFLTKPSPLTNQNIGIFHSEIIQHTVQDGDSLNKIASRYGVTVQTLRWANNMQEGAGIHPGDVLIVPPVDGVMHTVSRGQNVGIIAKLYDVPVDEIVKYNDIRSGYIQVGQQIVIPGGTPIARPTPTIIADQPTPTPSTPPTPAAEVPSAGTPAPRVEPAPVVTATVPSTIEYAEPSGGILQTPCRCFLTQGFRAGHYALDLQERGGGPIFAAEDGVVETAEPSGWNGGYGNYIVIDHGNGLKTLYAHNKELYVTKGDTVKRGQEISWMGNTGRVYGPTGIHLHFEVIRNGVKKNPMLFLDL